MTVAALVSGNCTLLKPAETSCVIAAKLTEILVELGYLRECFNTSQDLAQGGCLPG